MFNITIRNIPNDIIEKIKILSAMERRSLNSEILILLERGLLYETKNRTVKSVTSSTQIRIWEKLSGEWKDERNTDEIIRDIYSDRSLGRDVNL
ncbi:MAG: hypothetical protein JW969_08700 [Spirochaetales bacterium]|nr:hypothetical protein [Spirochaetales bacterium]